ncbi:FAD-linked oxidoreductase-like protein [Desarmillaria tabescens]|uniref:Proline dehydrogenase n=1 Tax=Armillaria tabescens TaxID=1929756 RepID=A0AA39MWH9_ARMTA|nr:FAD-linked oxidoreductase-like protein [Desarmillaria tabescens]KAK0449641.1 FAD-linked oxidoreductase-like protein [Desarmillaria tabescens]
MGGGYSALGIGAISGGILLATGLGLSSSSIHADSDSNDSADKKTPLRELVRSYIVFTMCSFPTLIDLSPTMLDVLTSIPGVKQVTEALVRVTFFNQFVGGDTALQTLPLLKNLRSANKGTLFAYSVEVDEHEATATASLKKVSEPVHKRIVNEMVIALMSPPISRMAIVAGAAAGRRTWVAVKLSALLPDANSLLHLFERLSRHGPNLPFRSLAVPHASDLDILYAPIGSIKSDLTEDDIKSLRELHADLIESANIIIDAEYRQVLPPPSALMREFNKLGESSSVQPLIYGTFQAYLKRTPSFLEQSFKDAKAGNYSLGVKLVRGAYHPHETTAHQAFQAGKTSLSLSSDPLPPVWAEKWETDKCYNECAKMLIGELKQDLGGKAQTMGILFGTHNWTSCDLILTELVGRGLAKRVEGDVVSLGDEVTERLTIGQLFGMGDALTDYLVERTRSSTPMIIKYVPYGAMSEVMPYLSRRAIENKSVLGDGQASEERRRAGSQIWKRIFG